MSVFTLESFARNFLPAVVEFSRAASLVTKQRLLLTSGLNSGELLKRGEVVTDYAAFYFPAGFNRTTLNTWQQRIRQYCLGKDNGENIMKSIKEGPFQMGTVSDVITGGTEGAVQQGPVRARVLNDLSAEEKERYKADIRATNILLQGIPKDIYSLINHYTDAKDIGKT
ncbi:hypothetical protein Tco_1327469 [Tanacetum coccineum]